MSPSSLSPRILQGEQAMFCIFAVEPQPLYSIADVQHRMVVLYCIRSRQSYAANLASCLFTLSGLWEETCVASGSEGMRVALSKR